MACERIKELILASEANNRTEAAKIYKEIRKREPATSFIQTASLKETMKILAKKKAYQIS